MDPWCIKHHGESGLTQAVKDSLISESECEDKMLEFIKQYTNKGMWAVSTANWSGQEFSVLFCYVEPSYPKDKNVIVVSSCD